MSQDTASIASMPDQEDVTVPPSGTPVARPDATFFGAEDDDSSDMVSVTLPQPHTMSDSVGSLLSVPRVKSDPGTKPVSPGQMPIYSPEQMQAISQQFIAQLAQFGIHVSPVSEALPSLPLSAPQQALSDVSSASSTRKPPRPPAPHTATSEGDRATYAPVFVDTSAQLPISASDTVVTSVPQRVIGTLTAHPLPVQSPPQGHVSDSASRASSVISVGGPLADVSHGSIASAASLQDDSACVLPATRPDSSGDGRSSTESAESEPQMSIRRANFICV